MSLQTRVINILTKPKDEWPIIGAEPETFNRLFVGYVVPLAAIPVVCGLIGSLLFVGAFGFRVGFGYALGSAILHYVVALAGVYISALVIQKLAPTFKSEGDMTQALKLVAYSMTPAWIAGVLYLIPLLGILAILAGLYGIYLFYLGVTPVMKTPQDQVIPFMVVCALVVIGVSIVLGLIAGSIAAAMFLTSRVY